MTDEKHERDLDLCWGHIKRHNAKWDGYGFGNALGVTRRDLAREMGRSYMYVHRLVRELVNEGSVKEKWTHMHQGYWDAHYRVNGPNGPELDETTDVIPF